MVEFSTSKLNIVRIGGMRSGAVQGSLTGGSDLVPVSLVRLSIANAITHALKREGVQVLTRPRNLSAYVLDFAGYELVEVGSFCASVTQMSA